MKNKLNKIQLISLDNKLLNSGNYSITQLKKNTISMRFLTTLSLLFSVAILSAQSNGRYWADIEPNQVIVPEDALIEKVPDAHRLLSLDLNQLRSELANAPMEFTAAARNSSVVVNLPMPDGSYESFEVVESSNMMPGLAAKFPEIKSFYGVGKNLEGAKTRFDYSPNGLFGSIEYNGESIYLMPAMTLQDEFYVCYYRHDIDPSEFQSVASCGATAEFLQENARISKQLKDEAHNHSHDQATVTRDLGELVELRTFRLAISTTAEFSNANGGTESSVMSAVNTAINRLNVSMINDCDVKFLLVDGTEELFFFDTATDPFNISALGSQLTDANQTLVDNVIGSANYDVGHLFQQGTCFTINDQGMVSQSLGGQAGGRVCTANGKARGIDCFSGGIIATVDRVMTHEMAHQFASGHTWNNCPGIDSQFAGGSATEPGSGSTIMSYLGSCGAQNISSFDGYYFNNESIVEVMNYSQVGGGSACANVIETTNNKPEVTLEYANGFFIPISTPFQLTGSATDDDGETLEYNWEQHDFGIYGPLNNPQGDAPLFRSFGPSVNGHTRIFPNIISLVNNQYPLEEYLPDYNRNLTFRLNARDNNLEAGGVDWKEVKFRSTESAGPFLVDFPNNSGISLTAGNEETVLWDVANTDNSIVKCKVVNILMSEDGGITYPHVLACKTPNDGEEAVTIPNIVAGDARIKVEAADNIFFDISNNNFSITAPAEPSFSLTACDQFQQICVPDVAMFDVSTSGFMGYESLLTLDIVEGLPAGVTPEFSTNPVMAGENTTLTVDLNDIDADGEFNVVLRAIGPSADTFYQDLIIEIVFNDFTDLEMLTPADGATSQELGPDFTWVGLPHADRYDFEIATSPTFTEDVMIESAPNLATAEYTLTVGLEDNTIYFWRIRPINKCGSGEYLVPFVFSTFSTVCTDYLTEQGSVGIGAGSNATAQGVISISENGSISDVNVVSIQGEYDAVPDLEMTLESPAGTKAILFGDICGNTSIYHLGLDDENPIPIGTDCPPTNGIAYHPQEELSIFDGENTQGAWKLNIRTLTNLGTGGFLANWGLEFCASFEPNGPFVVNNNLSGVQPLSDRRIHTEDLMVDDIDNVSYELDYTLLSLPAHGYLTFDGETLEVGDQFHQANIDWSDIRYFHTDATQEVGDTDEFYFIVEDGTGGWLGTPKFTLVLDETVSTSTVDLENTVDLFPNPAQNNINVAFSQPLLGNTTITVTDLQGRLLMTQKEQNLQGNLKINTTDFVSGVYFMTLQTKDAIVTKKFAVQR